MTNLLPHRCRLHRIARGSGRVSGTLARIATAAVLIPIVVAAVWWGPAELIALFVGLLTVMALLEFFKLGERAGFHGYRLWTAFCAALIVFPAMGRRQAYKPGVSAAIFASTRTFRRAIHLLWRLVLLVFVLGAALQF